MPVPDYLLSESAAGYALYEVTQSEEIGARTREFLESLKDLYTFSRLVKLVSFTPFKNAAHALENTNDISEGQVNETLKEFLSLNLPKAHDKHKSILGVSDPKLAGSIKYVLGKGYEFDTGDVTQDLLRGVRTHSSKMLKTLQPGDLYKAQLGLGHAYSRAKVKFNVNKSDNMIIQTIALLDQLDKDINTFAMRVREWYSWHFPELIKHVSENYRYAQLASLIRNKSELTDTSLDAIAGIVENTDLAQSIIDSAKISMGQDISDLDMENVVTFAGKVVKLANFRRELHNYLVDKMNIVAPNLSTLIGEMVGARLIAHAGSLTNLSKYPASTVQILGAEKALFRALKTKGNTPKYGLIYHSSFIGRAGARNKGRISRTLANKCTIAARIDSFSDSPSKVFGEALRKQVEERLAFFESGVAPMKNSEAMKAAMAKIEASDLMDIDGNDEEKPKKKKDKEDKKDKKDKKDKVKAEVVEAEAVATQLEGESKKEKKRKRDDEEVDSKKLKKEKKEKKKEKERKNVKK